MLAGLPSKRVHLGVLDLRAGTVETPEMVADRIRAGLEHVGADRLVVAPDCGMKYLAPLVELAKMEATVAGAATVRGELI